MEYQDFQQQLHNQRFRKDGTNELDQNQDFRQRAEIIMKNTY